MHIQIRANDHFHFALRRTSPGTAVVVVQLRIDVDRAARTPITAFFVTAVFWLLLGSVLALVASIKLHTPGFLADAAWLTFGRVRPAHFDTVAYGSASAACIGAGLWMMSRLCRAPIRNRRLLLGSAVLWNIGNAIGFLGVLGGWSTSVEWLEYPPLAALVLIVAFVPVTIELARSTTARRLTPCLIPNHRTPIPAN